MKQFFLCALVIPFSYLALIDLTPPKQFQPEGEEVAELGKKKKEKEEEDELLRLSRERRFLQIEDVYDKGIINCARLHPEDPNQENNCRQTVEQVRAEALEALKALQEEEQPIQIGEPQ